MEKTQTYERLEIEGHARTSELIYETGKVVAGLGLIAGFYGPIANYIENIRNPIKPQEIVRTYDDAQTTLNSLRDNKNKLEKYLKGYPYTTPDIEKTTKIRDVKKNISEYVNSINKTKEHISGLKETQDFKDYKKQLEIREVENNKRKIISNIGAVMFVVGIFGSVLGYCIRRGFESKQKNFKI